jgi:BTB/POZ domain-containing protein KCTD9
VPFNFHRWVKQKQKSCARLLDRSVPFRIFLSLLGAHAILFAVDQIDRLLPDPSDCQFSFACLINQFVSLVSVSNLESLSILVVAILYLIESRDRKKQKHYEAWQVIDNAAAARVPTSYARVQALQDLNEDGIFLCGLDLPKADLRGIDLRRANIKYATFSGADLKYANLKEANLEGANINGADLLEINLSGANLQCVNFKGANLTKANLKGANLAKANLSKANLTEANLEDANLEEANLAETTLRDANLENANLKDARLRESHLRGADCKGANLAGATMPDGLVYQNGDSR